MERFVIIVNGFQTLTIITKRSMLDAAAVLDPALPFIVTNELFVSFISILSNISACFGEFDIFFVNLFSNVSICFFISCYEGISKDFDLLWDALSIGCSVFLGLFPALFCFFFFPNLVCITLLFMHNIEDISSKACFLWPSG